MTAPALRIVNSQAPNPPYPPEVRANGWTFDLDMGRIQQSMTWLHCPPEMRPWLLMLWASAWMQAPCGTLPDDDLDIAVIIGAPPTLFATHRDALMRGWVRHIDGRLYHPVVTELVLRMATARRKTREKVAAWKQRHTVSNHPVTGYQPVSNPTVPVPEPVPVHKNTVASPDGFARWWSLYPRKTNKQAALKAWRKLNPDEALQSRLRAATVAQATSEQWRRGIIPHASTWLNQARWEDEVEAPQTVRKDYD